MQTSTLAVDLKVMEYRKCRELQIRVRDAVLERSMDETLLLVEHPPVITLGKRAKMENLLLDEASLKKKSIDVVEVERGGDVTYHGPGQLIAYPVFRIGRAVRDHVTSLVEALSLTCRHFGVNPTWDETRPGLWVRGNKIAAVGVHVRKGVALHGAALNVSGPLDGFQWIVPCGLHGAGVTSIERECAEKDVDLPPMSQIMKIFAQHLAHATGRKPFTFLSDLELFSSLPIDFEPRNP